MDGERLRYQCGMTEIRKNIPDKSAVRDHDPYLYMDSRL